MSKTEPGSPTGAPEEPSDLSGATILKPGRQAAAPAPAPAPEDLSGATILKPGRAPGAAAPPGLPRPAAPAPARSAGTGAAPAVARAAAPAAAAAKARNTLQPAGHDAATEHPDKSVAPKSGGAKKGPRGGDHIGHYELIRLIGKGGMGSVYLARDNKLGRKVAIKFLHTENPELAQRFVLEARATARCGHENIVIIYEADEWDGMPYMVLEYLQGQTLTKLLSDGKTLPPGRVVELMAPVVRALARAHEEGIAHRDLKPDNIFVNESGTIKVLDFGIAKVLAGDDEVGAQILGPGEHRAAESDEANEPTVDISEGITGELTSHGSIMGTMAYMSPEQWRGKDIDHRTDIWAVGIMLFNMLSGKHPLDGISGMALFITARLDHKMPSLRDKAPLVPPGLADVVDRCLKKPKDERFPDAVSLLRALEPFIGGRSHSEQKFDESPYAGLSSFQESDADRFFGRTHEVAALVNRLRDNPLLAVVGGSGAGKSSFVRAGVVPALKRSGEDWESLVLRPGRDPLGALAAAVAPMVSTSASIADELAQQQDVVSRLRNEPGYLGSVLRSRARKEKRNILLFVDQFEELYTLVPDLAERLAVTACLAGVADDATSPIRVVLSIRSDFLDRVAEDPRFMAELSHGLSFLSAPGVEGLRDALVQPAEMAGYRFESPAIVEDMLKHLQSTQGALPLLQFAAAKLWDSRDAAKKLLTEASYASIGGIAGALASHADSVVNELPPQTRNLAKSVFLRLVTPERTRAIVSAEELMELSPDAAELRGLLDQLVRARLIVVQTAGGGATAEIVHESLIHSWPTLRRWLDESGEDAAFLEQLRTAARQWHGKDRDAGLLWRGELVEEAERFQRRFRGQLPQQQQDFLKAVFALKIRGARLKRALTYGGVTFLLLLVAASGVAVVFIRDAQVEAEKQAVAARSAESVVKKQLEEVQRAEKERARAQEQEKVARAAAEKAAVEVQAKNLELVTALQEAKTATEQARLAKNGAVWNALAARSAEEKAQKANKSLEGLLKAQEQRLRNMEKQLGGSSVIDTLK